MAHNQARDMALHLKIRRRFRLHILHVVELPHNALELPFFCFSSQRDLQNTGYTCLTPLEHLSFVHPFLW